MKKVHTRTKRHYGLSTHLRHHWYFHPFPRSNRPKTFKTEESANAWVAGKGLNAGDYTLKKVKCNKKFQVVVLNGENKNSSGKKSNS